MRILVDSLSNELNDKGTEASWIFGGGGGGGGGGGCCRCVGLLEEGKQACVSWELPLHARGCCLKWGNNHDFGGNNYRTTHGAADRMRKHTHHAAASALLYLPSCAAVGEKHAFLGSSRCAGLLGWGTTSIMVLLHCMGLMERSMHL